MAHLTDTQHKTVGHTVLYVPDEGTRMAVANAHKDKDLVQRLEGMFMLLICTHLSLLCMEYTFVYFV